MYFTNKSHEHIHYTYIASMESHHNNYYHAPIWNIVVLVIVVKSFSLAYTPDMPYQEQSTSSSQIFDIFHFV